MEHKVLIIFFLVKPKKCPSTYVKQKKLYQFYLFKLINTFGWQSYLKLSKIYKINHDKSI